MFAGTYDVQSVIHTERDDLQCFITEFVIKSQALGCSLNVTYTTTGVSVAHMNMSRNTTTNTANGCVGVAVGGDYTLIVYDWESDGSVSTEPALIETIHVDMFDTHHSSSTG